MSTGLARMWSWVGERFNGTTDTGLGSRRGSQSVKPGQSVLVFLFLDLQKFFRRWKWSVHWVTVDTLLSRKGRQAFIVNF